MKNALFAIAIALLSLQAQAAQFNVTRPGAYFTSGFAISELVQTPDRIYPGDEVRLRFFIESTQNAGTANVNLNILAPFFSQNYEFKLGDLSPGVSKPIVVNFVVPTGTKPGSYNLYAYAVSGTSAQAQIAEIPIIVNEPLLSNALIAKLKGVRTANAGESVEVPVEIINIGGLAADEVVVQMQFASTNVITPIGTDRAFLPSIAAGGSASVSFTVGVNGQATPGYYPITLVVSYKVDKVAQPAITQSFGFKVDSKTGILVSAQTPSTTGSAGTAPSLLITLANVGDTAVRGVYAVATSDSYDFGGTSDKFIGTLNLDDSATMSLTLTPKAGSQGAPRTVKIKTSYKDYLNVEHVQEQDFPVNSLGNAFANGTGQGAGFAANQRFGRQTQRFTVFGVDPLVIGGAIAAMAIGFFAYRWNKRRKQ